jgi:superfamily I DNA/RNA helicase
MILCRTNKQVRAVQELGFTDVSTVHQAKGLEYDNVIVIDHTISSDEDLNIAYVALTRAKNNLFVINWAQFENYFKKF